jgi:hypothetical protein
MGRGSRGNTATSGVSPTRSRRSTRSRAERRERIDAIREGIIAAIRPLPRRVHGRVPYSGQIEDRIERSLIRGNTREASLLFAHTVGDGLGRGLDPGSVRPIAALHFLGIETTASCDGHDERGHRFPWIDVASQAEGQWLASQLPGWTLVQRGQGSQRSWRLNPKEISTIDNSDFDNEPREFWDGARAELAELADSVLED